MPSADSRRERLVVPDVLRGLALVAMLLAHASRAWSTKPWAAGFVIGHGNAVASPLFALVMGLSAQLLCARTPANRRDVLIAQQAGRGVILIVIGLWMSTWDTWVAIVLQFLGLLLIVGAPLVLLSTRWVSGIMVAVTLVSAPVNAWAHRHVHLDRPLDHLAEWVALGYQYRLTNLLPFFLAGALLAHHGFRRDRLLWAMLAAAPAAYVIRPIGRRLFDWDTISGSYPDTLHDIALVLLVYGVVVALYGDDAPSRPRPLPSIATLLCASGQLALSLYVLHIGVIWLWQTMGWRRSPNDPLLWLAVVPAPIAVGWLWWRYIGTGPLEWLLGVLTGRRKPLRT